jgi:single-strand DNA-binding protein
MINQVMLVGRLVDELQIEEVNGKKRAIITLAVSRNYKNEEGAYDTDFVDCILWQGIAENTAEYCHKGDLMGIKGRIETVEQDNIRTIQIIADKVTFLSSRQEKSDDLSA